MCPRKRVGAHRSDRRFMPASTECRVWRERDLLSALYTIREYPFALSDPVFAPYPAMKLGHLDSVAHFAELLAPAIRRWMIEAGPADRDWVLTSPPLWGLPCGANLVCRAIYENLVATLPREFALAFDALEVRGARTPIGSQTDFERYNDYSKQDLKTRQDFHLETDDGDATQDLSAFRGRRAVFVNDINVTGTQLDSIGKLLHGAGVKSLDCFLILNVEPRIGRRYPQLESEINLSRFAGADEFTAYLRDSDFRCTGKLISRLLSYDAESLARIFAALDRRKCELLHRAILQEDLYGGAFFKAKLDVVEHAAG